MLVPTAVQVAILEGGLEGRRRGVSCLFSVQQIAVRLAAVLDPAGLLEHRAGGLLGCMPRAQANIADERPHGCNSLAAVGHGQLTKGLTVVEQVLFLAERAGSI
jgi:hypothetical protein